MYLVKIFLSTLIIVYIGLFLSSCSNPVKPEMIKPYQLSDSSYFTPAHQRDLFNKEWKADTPPVIGLALAGGGTKAADFGLGILQSMVTLFQVPGFALDISGFKFKYL